ncbi:MAG: hypothetical protein DRN20_06680 [Thermoplasmata archaeon]|nr:MAG: hypothetical protein DRN20_06680 [Thermoplasmata archaeon]
MPKVAFVKINYEKGVEHAVRRAMRLAEWEKSVKGKRIFLKINAMGNQFVPGLNTSPLVLESVVKTIREKMKHARIIIGDTDLATVKQFWYTVKLWGYEKIARKYGCELVNLSEEKCVRKKLGGEIFDHIEIPKILTRVDSIITLPVIKTHGLTKITCCLKNSWGFLPRYRHRYHAVADKAIAEMNKAVRVDFAVVDGSICMQGRGPRTGKPKICDVILAGNDLVALDYVAAKFMGLNPETVKHIFHAENLGIGTTKNVKIVGDRFFVANFEPPKENIVFRVEKMSRKTPLVRKLFSKPNFLTSSPLSLPSTTPNGGI